MPSVLLRKGKNDGCYGKSGKIQKKTGEKGRPKEEKEVIQHARYRKHQKRV